ncbi:MAG: ABC transporter permease [Candidatus Atribacteria bacterium]|nr:ABC transporter permease [Candidatus Atribacteria bacterium]
MISVFVIISIFLPNKFLTVRNFQSMFSQIPEFGLLAIAMMLAMLTGGIDLSVVATANLSGIVAALVLTKYNIFQTGGYEEIYTILLAITAALIVSLICGFLNGVLVAYVGVPAILATLGTMGLFTGISIIVTKGYGIVGFPGKFLYIGSGTVFLIPIPMIIFIICVLAIVIIINRTTFGFSVFMLGSNPIAARFSGIRNENILIKAYMVSGLFAGIASIIMISRVNSIRPGYGEVYLLQAILVCVLGGVDPSGGEGNLYGLIMGIFTLQILQSGFNILSFSPFFKKVIWGLILILVMVINFYREKESPKLLKKV